MSERDPLEAPPQDSDLREEVEMTAHLIVAANDSEAPLSQEVVDDILGVEHDPDSA